MQSTKNYDMFKFREDNRARVEPSHVRTLVKSIQSRNMLEYKPIIVNENYEVVDGQHRLLAAKELNVPIYYVIEPEFTTIDMIHLQTQKQWKTEDYINAYAKNGNQEYQRVLDFSKENEVPLTVALALLGGRTSEQFKKIKTGEFKYKSDKTSLMFLDYCRDIHQTIIHNLGNLACFRASKFWRAMAHVCKNPIYNHDKMMKNLVMLITKVNARPSYSEYVTMLLSIHNYRNQNKITTNTEKNEDDDE